MWVPPAARLRDSVFAVIAPLSQSPQLLASGHMSHWDCSPTPVPILRPTDTHTQVSLSQPWAGLSNSWLGPYGPSSSHLLLVLHPPRHACPPHTPLAPSFTYSPAQLAGSLGVLTYTLAHPHSLKVLHHRHTALQPMVWLQLLHSNPYTHTYTENRIPHPGKNIRNWV